MSASQSGCLRRSTVHREQLCRTANCPQRENWLRRWHAAAACARPRSFSQRLMPCLRRKVHSTALRTDPRTRTPPAASALEHRRIRCASSLQSARLSSVSQPQTRLSSSSRPRPSPLADRDQQSPERGQSLRISRSRSVLGC
eukprot:2882566-Rhodomonas_salina.2